MSGPVIEDGGIEIHEGRIVRAGSWRDFEGAAHEDLGEVMVLPGLINAHCHLDYSIMKGAILRQSSFAGWIRRINELKRTLTDEDYLDSIRRGFDELRQWGTTSVLNIESFPELMVRMPRPPIRTWWFYELLDIRSRLHTEDVVAGALSFFEERKGWLGGFGLSPHSPYTASAGLFELAKFCCEKYAMPWTTHLAETDEEFRMFFKGEGPLYEFLYSLGRNMSDTGAITPVARLLEIGAIPEGGILVHMNCLADSDYTALARRNVHVVHCPRCHEYFGRMPFELERFRESGVPVLLGTDSLASNSSLDLFEEMRTLRRTHPMVPVAEVLDMVTRKPARALGFAGKLGEISPGAHADLIAIPYTGSSGSAIEAVLENRTKIGWMMVGGQKISREG